MRYLGTIEILQSIKATYLSIYNYIKVESLKKVTISEIFKSINISTFTLGRNSLLIWGFHFTLDFLLLIRLFSEGEKQFLLHVNIHGLWQLFKVQPHLYSGLGEMTEQSIVKETFQKNIDCHPTQGASLLTVWLS